MFAYVVRHVSVEDYGLYLLAQSIAGFLYILDFGLSGVMVQLYVSTLAGKGMADVGRLASTLFVLLLGVGTVGAAVLWLLAAWAPGLIRLPALQTPVALHVLILSAVMVQLSLPASALEHLCQAFQRFDRINQVQIATLIVRAVLTVMVLAAGKGIVGLAAVQAAASLVRLLGFWVVARTGIRGLQLRLFCFDWFRVRQALKSSSWAFGDFVSGRIGMNAEPVILGGLGSVRQVALFGMGSKLPAHIFQFAARGLDVMLPALSLHHAAGDTARLRQMYGDAYRVCLTGLLPLVVFAAICSRPLVEIWAGSAYRGAAPVLAWLLVSSFAQVLDIPSTIVLYTHDRIPQAARVSVASTVGKIIVALALVAPFGVVGVAAGVALWHWCVNLFGYLPAACRVAEMRPGELWREALFGRTGLAKAGPRFGAGQGWMFAVGVAALFLAARHLAAVWTFAACMAACAMYAAVWLACTAWPMWREGQNVRAVAG